MPEESRILERHARLAREQLPATGDVEVPPLRAAAVVGAGTMGLGIAQVLAVAGLDVRIHDIRQEAVDRAIDRIRTGRFGIEKGVERGKLGRQDADAALGRLRATSSLEEACDGAQLALETVYEEIGLKIRTFGLLDAAAPPDAILASNTSGFPIAALAGATRRPDRVIGWHWASPPPVMKLAEIVVHPATAAAVRDAVVDLARRCGKNPHVVRDQPLHWGFVTNRVLMAVFAEADRIVAEDVATREQVDGLLKDCFGWPVGPFEMLTGTTSGWE